MRTFKVVIEGESVHTENVCAQDGILRFGMQNTVEAAVFLPDFPYFDHKYEVVEIESDDSRAGRYTEVSRTPVRMPKMSECMDYCLSFPLSERDREEILMARGRLQDIRVGGLSGPISESGPINYHALVSLLHVAHSNAVYYAASIPA